MQSTVVSRPSRPGAQLESGSQGPVSTWVCRSLLPAVRTEFPELRSSCPVLERRRPAQALSSLSFECAVHELLLENLDSSFIIRTHIKCSLPVAGGRLSEALGKGEVTKPHGARIATSEHEGVSIG